MMSSLTDRLMREIERVLGEPVTLDTDLHVNCDGLRFHEAIMAVEDLADLEVADRDVERVRTVADLVSLISERVGEPA
jgi:acyl carrier protein